ncbi:MAG: bifunctional 4-hydroxy-2-oxoglutarate aldolase/2-dehydro-3-deoxy-phosphogluconate aldolase [Microcystaceae cyanobacterium]
MSNFSPVHSYAQAWLDRLHHGRGIAVIRVAEVELGQRLAELAIAGGIRLIEITWNSTYPEKIIAALRESLPDCLIGTGTVLTLQDLQAAIACGSQFCFTPHVNPRLIEKAIAAEIPIIPGALTPTEIVTAWQMGASAVKVFPVQSLGGANYIKSLQGPLGTIPLIPTGGVTLENALDFIQAGAIAVGLSGALFPKDLIAEKNWSGIQIKAQRLSEQLKAK